MMPSKHPQLNSAYADMHLYCIREWLEGGWDKIPPSSYWHPKEWSGNNYLVFNFQNSVPRCNAPSDSEWVSYCTGFPPPNITGFKVIQIGNEINTGTYYNGSQKQYIHLLQLCYPILHSKGYVVECGSTLNEKTYLQGLIAGGASDWCDRFDTHAYYDRAGKIADQYDSIHAIVSKPLDMSEFGVRNDKILSSETGAILMMLRGRDYRSVFIPFSMTPYDSVNKMAPLDKNYMHNGDVWDNFFSAMN